jgi:hypothetical protein
MAPKDTLQSWTCVVIAQLPHFFTMLLVGLRLEYTESKLVLANGNVQKICVSFYGNLKICPLSPSRWVLCQYLY